MRLLSSSLPKTKVGDEKQPPPHQNVATVIETIGTTLIGKFGRPMNFTVAGSFAAAIVGFHDYHRKSELPYNDIDVFVAAENIPEDVLDDTIGASYCHGYTALHAGILDVSYSYNNIGGIQVPLNFVIVSCLSRGPSLSCEVDLKALVEAFDINAVQAGFNVEYDKTYHCWKISSWEVTSQFVEFMDTETLAISCLRCCKSPASSLMRIAHKSCQLNVKMKLPTPSTVQRYMTQRPVSKMVVDKWEKLPSKITDLPHFAGLKIVAITKRKKKDGSRSKVQKVTEEYFFRKSLF